MSTRELVELAQLDAMGLLDEQEAREFEVAFAAAPAEIQEQIRKEQSRMCVLEPVLPDVQAPEHLRGKVLAAVHEAIVESIVETAPAGASAPVAMVEMTTAARGAAPVRHEGGRALPSLGENGRRRGLTIWRSTAIAFAAAAFVLGITTIRLQSQFERVIAQNSTGESIEKVTSIFGVDTHKFFFSPGTERAILYPATAGVNASDVRSEDWSKVSAVVWHNPDSTEARLICENLPTLKNKSYQLVAISDEGAIRVLGDDLKPTAGGLMAFAVSSEFSSKTDRIALRVIDAVTQQATIILEAGPRLG